MLQQGNRENFPAFFPEIPSSSIQNSVKVLFLEVSRENFLPNVAESEACL